MNLLMVPKLRSSPDSLHRKVILPDLKYQTRREKYTNSMMKTRAITAVTSSSTSVMGHKHSCRTLPEKSYQPVMFVVCVVIIERALAIWLLRT